MSKRLKDLRTSIQSVEEADLEFQNIARLECDIARLDAKFDTDILTIKEIYQRARNEYEVPLNDAKKRLTAFVEANKHLFQKPRRKKTPFGTYGLPNAASVRIDDKDDAIRCCLERNWTDCVKTTLTLLSKPLRDRLQSGESCAGARLLEGDIASYTVKKELLDKAKGQ